MSVTFALHFHGMKTSWERYMIVTCIFEPEYYKHKIWTLVWKVDGLVSREGVTNPWCNLQTCVHISGCTYVALTSCVAACGETLHLCWRGQK